MLRDPSLRCSRSDFSVTLIRGTPGSPRKVPLPTGYVLPRRFLRSLFINAREGAQTTLYCCLAEDVKGFTYYNNALGVVPSSRVSYDRQRAAAMWELSEKLTRDFKI